MRFVFRGFGRHAALVAAFVVALTCTCATARATSYTVIGFDEQTGYNYMQDQYATADAYGGVLGSTSAPDGSLSGELLMGPSSGAASPPNVAQPDVHCTGVPKSTHQRSPARNAHIPRNTCNQVGDFSTWLSFPTPRSVVAAYVGAPTGNGGLLGMQAYDVDGNPIGGTTYVNVAANSSVSTRLSVRSSPHSIAYIAIIMPAATANNGGNIAIDNLAFDQPTTPPSPDFGLTTYFQGSAYVQPGLAGGESISRTVIVRRYDGSTGPVSFSAAHLPPGVHATFSPNPASGGNGQRVTVTLSADKNVSATNATIQIVGTPSSSAVGPGPRITTLRLHVVTRFDLRAAGLDVIQATQYGGSLFPSGENRYTGSYQGVKLVQGAQTVARFYVDSGPATVSGATAELIGYAPDGSVLPGSPVMADYGGPGTIAGYPFVDQQTRATGPAYVFTLPADWTYQPSIRLKATVYAPAHSFIEDPQVECDTPECRANNVFNLSNIKFTRVRPLTINPLIMLDKRPSSDLNPGSRSVYITGPTNVVVPLDQAYGPLLAMFPEPPGALNIHLYQDVVDYTYWDYNNTQVGGNDLNGKVSQQVADWDNNHEHPGDIVSGVQAGMWFGQAPTGGRTDHGQADQRPLTDLAHEITHNVGMPHTDAGTNLGGCGGQANPNGPQPTGFDARGDLGGIGLDRRTWPYKIIANETVGGEAYDLMSYCNGGVDAVSWIAPATWDATVSRLTVGGAKDAGLADPRTAEPASIAGSASLHVTADQSYGGPVTIDSVEPERRPLRAPGAPTSVRAVALDAHGSVITSVGMTGVASTVHNRGRPSSPIVVYDADLAASRAAAVEILAANGARLAMRVRSAHAPKVRVLAPRRGKHVGRGRTITVRWRATDLDRNPLAIDVDYSTNAGRSFKTVLMTYGGSSAKLPSSLFAGSRRARIRVRANDGFNETAALSSIFVAAGHPPTVRITSPVRGTHIHADGLLLLSGSAQDDNSRPLRGKALRWYLGGKLIGTGSQTNVSGLPSGRRRVMLVARDHSRRKGIASVIVTFVPVRAIPIALRAPKKISRHARRVTLRIKLNVPAVLRSGRFRLSLPARTLRTVSIPIRAGNRRFVLHLTLTAGHRRTRLAVPIRR